MGMNADYRKIQEMQKLNRIKENNDCLTCEVVITKEFKESPISIIQGSGGPIEMAQMVKTLRDIADTIVKEFPETKQILPMLKSGGVKTSYKQVETWGEF